MKNKKYFSVLLFISILCGACEKEDPTGCKNSFYEHFIREYHQGSLNAKLFQTGTATTTLTVYNTGFVINLSNPERYIDGDLKYDRWAVRNKDMSFNQWLIPGELPTPCAYADNFTEMHVVSNSDWDEMHPAGTLLDDILSVRIYSFAKFIHSGYHLEENEGELMRNYRCLNIIKKPISELTTADMEMIVHSMSDLSPTTKSPVIIFTSAPTLAKTHTLTLSWTTVEGHVKTASITCTPEVDPTLL